MTKIKTKPERKPEPIDSAVISQFAREFADWRLNGCPGYGFSEAFKARLAKAARKDIGSGLRYKLAAVSAERIALM